MPLSIQEKINKILLSQWCQKHQIDFCILFGSSVTGQLHKNSDIDIAVYSSKNELLKIKFMPLNCMTMSRS